MHSSHDTPFDEMGFKVLITRSIAVVFVVAVTSSNRFELQTLPGLRYAGGSFYPIYWCCVEMAIQRRRCERVDHRW